MTYLRAMEQSENDATLILVRHGETVWNRDGRWQGQRDAPLTDRGREQAARIAAKLAPLKISAIYSSDLGRAKETAEAIAAPHTLSVMVREDLRERSYGVLEGKTTEEAARTEGAWFLPWQADHLARTPPAGETQPDMSRRVMAALYEIAEAHPSQTVLISTHGGPIKSAVYHVLSIPLTLWRLTWIANGSISILRGTPDLMRVASFNDTCHLAPAAPTAAGDEA